MLTAPGDLLLLGGDGVGRLEGQAEDVDGALEGVDGAGVITLPEGGALGQLAVEEAGAVGEDLAVLDVDVEVGVVDVDAVHRLLEVDVGDAVGAHVVVLDDAELGAGGHLLGQVAGHLEVVGAGDRGGAGLAALDGRGLGVGRVRRERVLAQVDAALGEDGAAVVRLGPGLGVGHDRRGQAGEAENHGVLHPERLFGVVGGEEEEEEERSDDG